ncbi:MAG: hypothetical protein L0Y44_01485 [Phycisphaerales bacterium]|nr:hypothetical protein [Phycisphaerales bacterium]MCI0675770.1 hypothetical protein [Phycisphaerales bacterium]
MKPPTGISAGSRIGLEDSWLAGTCDPFASLQRQLSQLGFGDGTGSAYQIGQNRVSIVTSDSQKAARTIVEIPDLRDQIAVIRAAFSLQMTELAAALGVERPTVYGWVQGKNAPYKKNRDRLHQIYRMAKRWQALSSVPIRDLIRQPTESGKSIIDLLNDEQIDETKVTSLLDAFSSVLKERSAGRKSASELAEIHGIQLESDQARRAIFDVATGKRFSDDE